MKKVLIAANWKMHKTVGEAARYIEAFLPLVSGWDKTEIAICPPYTCLPYLKDALHDSGVLLGAQNVFWEVQGAFTGEISTAMLTDMNCRYVIVGHSERRHILGESDMTINRKLEAVSGTPLIPIFCVGETQQEREDNQAKAVVERQLETGLAGIDLQDLVIAYEPIWAIGTGLTASPADAQEMSAFIRSGLAGLIGGSAVETRILYGGSVTPKNIESFIEQPDINGALVGGASLSPEDFAAIVRLNGHV